MRVRILTLSLALVIGVNAIGCKSAPKLPWFSSASTTTAGASAATMASTAPQLPSEVAKQAEALAAADPVKITTPAPQTTAATKPGAYPSTGAKDYLSTSPAALMTAASPTVSNVATTTKSALPYDPNAVPASSTASMGPASTTPASTDRYGMLNQDRYANAYPATTSSPVSNSYPNTTTPSAPFAPLIVSTTPEVPMEVNAGAPYASNPESTSLGERYATQNVLTASPVGATPSNYSAQVQPASAVASVQPYRPGGTSSYPGTSASYEVATQPTSTSTGIPAGGTVYR